MEMLCCFFVFGCSCCCETWHNQVLSLGGSYKTHAIMAVASVVCTIFSRSDSGSLLWHFISPDRLIPTNFLKQFYCHRQKFLMLEYSRVLCWGALLSSWCKVVRISVLIICKIIYNCLDVFGKTNNTLFLNVGVC